MIEFIYKSLRRSTLNTGYKPRNIRKSHTKKNNDITIRKKQSRVNWSASSGVIFTRSGTVYKGLIIPVGTIRKEIHIYSVPLNAFELKEITRNH